MLILLESVTAGVLSLAVRLGGDKDVLAVFAKGLAERIANIRLGDTKAEGNA